MIKALKLIIISIVLIILILFCFAAILEFSHSDFLSGSHPVEANMMVIEGWLDDKDIELACQEAFLGNYDYVVTTGVSLPDYFIMNKNGYLVFYPPISDTCQTPMNHIIEITCHGSMNKENRSQFSFYINDSLMERVQVGTKKRKFAVSWFGPLSVIDSIVISFDNDDVGNWGDRNLFVKEVILDKKLFIPYKNHSVYVVNNQNGTSRTLNVAESYSEEVKNKLILLGLDPGKIIAVPGEKTNINRTRATAEAFKKWLVKSGIKVRGINVISVGRHSFRSWMVYRKIMGPSYRVGVISLHDYQMYSWKLRLFWSFREVLGILYYRIVFIPVN